MSGELTLRPIGHIHTEFPEKFGIPRQSGLVEGLRAVVELEPEFRVPEAFRGVEGFSHLWLLWQFTKSKGWSPTVRPPRLGGNQRMGVFATRSPFRPNPIGLSCVKIDRVEQHPELGPVIHVLGADLLDGTPILDLKPYLPYADAHPEAAGGFTDGYQGYRLEVNFPPELLAAVPWENRDALQGVLAQDPRPSYQADPQRVYGMAFGGQNIRFTVAEGVLTVVAVE